MGRDGWCVWRSVRTCMMECADGVCADGVCADGVDDGVCGRCG